MKMTSSKSSLGIPSPRKDIFLKTPIAPICSIIIIIIMIFFNRKRFLQSMSVIGISQSA